MKKIRLLICCLFIITGCSDSKITKVVCTKGGTENTVSLTSDVKDKKLSGPIKAELYFNDEEEAKNVCDIEKEFISTLDEKIKYEVTCKTNEVIIDDYTFILSNQGIKVKDVTKTAFSKKMAEYGFDCK